MTPVEQVQQFMTAIGETTYDPERRERLTWEELREVQAAIDEWHEEPWCGLYSIATINLARELCNLAYVAIGTAVLRFADGWVAIDYSLGRAEAREHRWQVERDLLDLFSLSNNSVWPIRRAAAYYGFGDKLTECFTEVHRANMRKMECEACGGKGSVSFKAYSAVCCPACNGTGRHVRRDPDGRIIKPAGWQPADLGPILFPEKA